MKKFILLLLIGCSWSSVQSQNVIRGKVHDQETGEMLIGVSIWVTDLHTGAVTDTSGIFVIRNVPLGNFLAEVHFTGYASQAVTLVSHPVADTSTNYIALQQTITEYHPVIITGTAGAADRMKNPVPSEMQSRDHLFQHPTTNAVSGLAEVPGISTISTGNAVSKPVIRGLGYNRVVVLRDNLRQEGQQWGDEHGVEIDEYEIDRVEIIKGPGSIMYGSDAMAGVINFLTPRTPREGYIGGEFITGYQTNGNLFGNSLMQTGNINGFSWQIRGSNKIAGNYFTPVDGYVANSGFRETNFSGFVGLNRSWGVSRICFSSFNQQLGLAEGDRDSLGNFTLPYVQNDTVGEMSFTNDQLKGFAHSIEIPRQNIRHHRVVLSNDFFFGDSRLKLDIGFQQNNRFEYGDVLAPGEAGLAMKLNTATANAVYFLPEHKQGQISLGVNYQHQSNSNAGNETLIPDYTTNDAGAFIYAHKTAGQWFFGSGLRADIRILHADLRMEDTLVKFAALDRKLPSISAVIGGTYSLKEKPVVFRLNFSRGFRVPNFAELASNGKHEGTFRYEIGAPDLKPETSFQIDAGVSTNYEHFNCEVSLFYNDIQNFIHLAKLSAVNGGDSIPDPADPAPAYTFTAGHAQLYGGEIFTDLHPHPLDWLHFENSFSFVIAQLIHQPDSMRWLPFTPPMKYQSEVNVESDKQYKCFKNINVSLSGQYYFSQNNVYSAFGTETPTPGYFLLNAGASTEIVNKKGNEVCRIYFSASNLLNTKYQSHLSRLKYAPENPVTGQQGLFGEGRNFSVRIIVPFSFTRS